jgi:hypothetical protein
MAEDDLRPDIAAPRGLESVNDEAIELQLSSLIGKGEGEFVSLEHEIPESTGQFIRFRPTGRGGRSLRAEAASNDVLTHPYRLSLDQVRVIMSLGWTPPKKKSPNFSKEFKPSAPADFQGVVALARKTFRDGYQLPEDAPISLRTSSDAPAASTAPVAEDDLRPDIAAAREQMRATIGSGKEVKHLAPHLWEGERVERMAQGQGKKRRHGRSARANRQAAALSETRHVRQQDRRLPARQDLVGGVVVGDGDWHPHGLRDGQPEQDQEHEQG